MTASLALTYWSWHDDRLTWGFMAGVWLILSVSLMVVVSLMTFFVRHVVRLGWPSRRRVLISAISYSFLVATYLALNQLWFHVPGSWERAVPWWILGFCISVLVSPASRDPKSVSPA
jgi:hypothetical protein